MEGSLGRLGLGAAMDTSRGGESCVGEERGEWGGRAGGEGEREGLLRCGNKEEK
jgi:hypothetical protein